jgi:hypothetical protein
MPQTKYNWKNVVNEEGNNNTLIWIEYLTTIPPPNLITGEEQLLSTKDCDKKMRPKRSIFVEYKDQAC